MTATDGPVLYNPFDPGQVDHHDALLRRLRHDSPVAEVMPGLFYLSRHADIMAVCRDPETFRQGRFQPTAEDTRSEDELNLGETDPPVHTKVRKVLAGFFTTPHVRPYEPYVRDVCRRLVDGFASADSADLIAELGVPLPAAVIGHVAGIPAADRDGLRRYSDDYIALGNADGAVAAAAAGRVADFDARLLAEIRARRSSGERPPDLISALLDAVGDDGGGLSDTKILTHVSKDVIVGGIETTTHLIGNLFYDLLSTPGAYERVRQDRTLVAVAVEEALRIRCPVQILFRQPVRDVELGGVHIPAGSIVALGYASANHDEALFDDPDHFDLDRGEALRHHLGFGWGIHLCVGAALARMELRCALDAVLDRFPALELAPGFRYERVRFFMMRGPVRLDVVRPAS